MGINHLLNLKWSGGKKEKRHKLVSTLLLQGLLKIKEKLLVRISAAQLNISVEKR